ncbi:hypothetical protein F4806DRAFT_501868 [Annulohypoxylon nitens]|nr:hypothetical protein F4806DRAFT_501868 [Annulohypoxylon nitens]
MVDLIRYGGFFAELEQIPLHPRDRPKQRKIPFHDLYILNWCWAIDRERRRIYCFSPPIINCIVKLEQDTSFGNSCFLEIVANLDELCEILERGKIPLIHIIEESDKSSKIRFEEYDPRKNEKGPYVAISHVWSDGLGNLHQNALPRCQLRRLSDLVKALPGDYSARLFWCDTICIPPDSVNRPKAQSCALDQMRTVYSKPKTVLVLDSWLLESSMQGKRDIETLMRIFACTWNTRLWTYQEGALPKSLHFQFADGPYDLDIGMRTAENASTNIVEQADIIIPLRARWNSLRCFKDKRQVAERLSAIANELGHRRTSVATDEALCLAVLLDLDAGKIFEIDPDLRMQEIWKALQFRVMGLQWVKFGPHPTQSSSARQTADGICIQEIGIRFVREDGDFSGLFILRDQNQRFYHIAVETSYVGDIMWEQFANLLDCTIDHFQSTWMFTDDTETKSFGAILVGILSIGDFVHCQRLEVGRVTVLGHEAAAIPREILPPRWQWGSSYYLCYEDGIRNCVKDAQLMPLQQKWCIG